MGSIDFIYDHSKKRNIEECIKTNDFHADAWSSVCKRICTDIRAPEQQSDDLFLEGTFPEEITLQSDSQEDPISEMFRSLEEVISTTEESSLSKTSHNSPPAIVYRSSSGRIPCHQEETQFTLEISTTHSSPLGNEALCEGGQRSSDPTEYLFGVCDDELWIPSSPHSNGESIFNLTQDILCVDGNWREPIDSSSNIPIVTETTEQNRKATSGHAEWPLEILELLIAHSTY
eukprot:c47037_g1_i1 orf=712-1404(+)